MILLLNLNFFKVDNKKFPAIKIKPILNKYNSLPIILNAANEIFVDQFLKKNMSFCSIIKYLFYLLKDPKMRKYAIKKPSNLKTILTIDKWTRNKAMEILSQILNEKIIINYITLFLFFNTFSAEIIKKIEITGNERVSDETIKVYGDISINQDIDNIKINEIIKNLYSTNFFEDINISVSNKHYLLN